MGTGRVPLRPPRRKKGKKRPNIFAGPTADEPPGVAVHFRDDLLRILLPSIEPDVLIDDRGFPDRQVDYDHLEEHADDLPILRKSHGTPLPDTVDPNVDTKFNAIAHGAHLIQYLKTGHLAPDTAKKLIHVIKKHWRVFNPAGVKFSIIGYECDSDTEDVKPVSCRTANYIPRESKVTEKYLNALLDMHHIYQIVWSPWMSKALLAPKPHQETIYNIVVCVQWRTQVYTGLQVYTGF